jgi:hypothetical protein
MRPAAVNGNLAETSPAGRPECRTSLCPGSSGQEILPLRTGTWPAPPARMRRGESAEDAAPAGRCRPAWASPAPDRAGCVQDAKARRTRQARGAACTGAIPAIQGRHSRGLRVLGVIRRLGGRGAPAGSPARFGRPACPGPLAGSVPRVLAPRRAHRLRRILATSIMRPPAAADLPEGRAAAPRRQRHPRSPRPRSRVRG